MLRFGTTSSHEGQRRFRFQRGGVGMLLLMLGMVLLAMRQLGQPSTVASLGRLFSPAGTAKTPADGNPASIAPAVAPVDDDEPLGDQWDVVKDNSLFLPAERPAWFALFKRVRASTPEALARRSAGEVAYAQLVNQPDAYRAKSVRVRGRVLRQSLKRAPENSLGVDSYHQLWLAPVGGGQWPIVVYALELPEGFPRGDGLRADVTVDGLFFKNWSFPYEGGMGLAPVLVSRSVQWTPAPVAAAPRGGAPIDSSRILLGVFAAAVGAMGFVAWTILQTRRRRWRRQRPNPDFVQWEAKR